MARPDPTIFARTPWMDMPQSALGPSREVPTMLDTAERKLYLWLAREWAMGVGAVVDLGAFVGGSTALLAEGLRQAGLPGPVHAYDTFTISDRWKEKYLYSAGVAQFDGPDMLPVAQALLAPWQGMVTFHPGRIEHQIWDHGAIEILTLDASKTAWTMDRQAEIFFPSLIPGRSVIVQQDFLHWKQPWVAVQMARMADWFLPLARAPKDSMAFLCIRDIDETALEAGRCAGLTDAEMIAEIEAMHETLRGFGIGTALKRLAATVESNPGVRTAFNMSKAPTDAA